MEINPQHPIIKTLIDKIKTEGGSNSIKDLIWLLYDTSLLSSGFTNDDPVRFSNRILRLISLGLDIDETEQLPEAIESSSEQNVEDESTMEEVD
jgi:molecular chaperone HtpG